MITPEILKKVAPTLSKEKSVVITDAINNICPVYGISEPNILHEFLATILHESGEFAIKEENMNYRAARIHDVWPSRFPTIQSAIPVSYTHLKHLHQM